MDISYIKALHIIFVVSWFAGLFYIVRLFIYFAEAEKKEEPAKKILQTQYKIAILTGIFAFWMLWLDPSYLSQVWMHIKLSFVLALYFYHAGCHVIFNQQQQGIVKYPPMRLRIWNEIATILLFAIVFVVVLKSALSWIWGVAGIIVFGVLMMLAIRLYKKIREKRDWDNFEEEILNDKIKKEK